MSYMPSKKSLEILNRFIYLLSEKKNYSPEYYLEQLKLLETEMKIYSKDHELSKDQELKLKELMGKMSKG